MTVYQRLIEYHNDLLKAERCFKLFDGYLDTNYVEDEEQLRLTINAALSNSPEMREVIINRIENCAYSEAGMDTIESFFGTIAAMLNRLNIEIFDDWIIGCDIIKKYHLNKG